MEKLYNPYLKRSISINYIDYTKDSIPFPLKNMINVMNEWEGDFSDCSLLDIGCGTGDIINNDFVKKFNNYTGVEPSKEFFRYANKHNKYSNNDLKTEFYNCSVENLPFEDESFGFLISTEVWYYIKDIDMAAKECSRVLKDNSQFLIYTRHPDKILDWSQIKEIISESDADLEVRSKLGFFREIDLGKHFFSKISSNNLINSFRKVNLEVTNVEKYPFDRIMIQGIKKEIKNENKNTRMG
tara:strand:- start:134 stop:856 length:723 start_codon:yes stop_codon:yes gene_type:complete